MKQPLATAAGLDVRDLNEAELAYLEGRLSHPESVVIYNVTFSKRATGSSLLTIFYVVVDYSQSTALLRLFARVPADDPTPSTD